MDQIDNEFPAIKDKINLNQEIVELCEIAEIRVKDDRRGGRTMRDVEKLSNELARKISDARESADQRKEEVKSSIAKKVPKLDEACKEF